MWLVLSARTSYYYSDTAVRGTTEYIGTISMASVELNTSDARNYTTIEYIDMG